MTFVAFRFTFGPVLLLTAISCVAQSFDTVPAFPLSHTTMRLQQPALPNHPFTVTGKSAAILGLQSGNLELWNYPTKIFNNLHLTAELDGYAVPIDLNAAAASIDVEPDHTTIVYSHAAITVRQHMFVPAVGEGTAGGVILFEIECAKPTTLTVSMDPAMVQMWPAPQFGRPGLTWVQLGTGGGYVMATDNPSNFGFVAMPNATPGVQFPYQERPQTLPMQFKVRYEPQRDRGRYFALLSSTAQVGESNNPAGVKALKDRVLAENAKLPDRYRATSAYYAHIFDHRLTVETPDAAFNVAMRWAEIAIDQLQVRSGKETGLVAGWYPAFDSTRPGFGWFFGRDTLWSIYAVDSYGDHDLARNALEFIAHRQRTDGKIMHEFSQTAATLTGDLEWSRLGYQFAAADATPLFIMAVADYIRATGDTEFLRAHFDEVKKAWNFDRTHDTDGDGVYDNSQGTGWVEAWPPAMPHQEIYLAALDELSTRDMAYLATLNKDAALASNAQSVAAKLAEAVAKYRLASGLYAFSRSNDGIYDATNTVFPSVALWLSGKDLVAPGASLTQWASADFATDWGTRSVSGKESIFDPMAYHQGSVWPLFTGWNAMAQYRASRPMAGYASLMRNVDLTWAQDPGFVTEVLSGELYQPLGRSSSHQLWSSAMALVPVIRGLFGVEGDATTHTLQVRPQLPANWPSATLHNVRLGSDSYTVTFRREQVKQQVKQQGQMHVTMQITVTSAQPTVLCLNQQSACTAKAETVHTASVPLPAVELFLPDQKLPEPGSHTMQPRIVDERSTPRSLEIMVEALAGTQVVLQVIRNDPSVSPHTRDAELEHQKLTITMPSAVEGKAEFLQKHVVVGW